MDEISLSITGCCQECVYVSIDQDIFDVRRKQALKALGDLPELRFVILLTSTLLLIIIIVNQNKIILVYNWRRAH